MRDWIYELIADDHLWEGMRAGYLLSLDAQSRRALVGVDVLLLEGDSKLLEVSG
jgi:hypothetical protein